MGVRFGAAKRGFWRGGGSRCEWLGKDRAGWSIAGFWCLHSISSWSTPEFQAVLGGPKCLEPSTSLLLHRQRKRSALSPHALLLLLAPGVLSWDSVLWDECQRKQQRRRQGRARARCEPAQVTGL